MTSISDTLNGLFAAALVRVAGEAGRGVDPLIRPAGDARFGDYQSNVAMSLGKRLGRKPRELAEALVEALRPEAKAVLASMEVAGPGFINLHLNDEWLAETLDAIPEFTGETPGPHRRDAGATPDRLGIEPAATPETVVVDYSSPNVAKQMHVGHLRSTIIGDAIARVLEFEGHRVVRQNHIGDWGTQFGHMILALWHICMRGETYIRENLDGLRKAVSDGNESALAHRLESIVQMHNTDNDSDREGERFSRFLKGLEGQEKLPPSLPETYQFVSLIDNLTPGRGFTTTIHSQGRTIPYENLSREITSMLQQGGKGNEQERKAWSWAKELTLKHYDRIYRRLGVSLTRGDVRGESFYEARLPAVVTEVKDRFGPGAGNSAGEASGIAIQVKESEGALCVFHTNAKGEPVFKKPDGKPLPLIIQKSGRHGPDGQKVEGAFLYATTDLAAVKFRIEELGAERIIYVTDARQIQHFEMVFATVLAAGWTEGQRDSGTEGQRDHVLSAESRRPAVPPSRHRAPVRLEHVSFGSILGADRKPLKTRSGENVKLADLLDEAVGRAKTLILANEADPQKKRGFDAREIELIAEAVGIGAVKYADLSQNRQSDYVFSWDKMLAMEGNTAPYMMYAYARIRSIYRKGADGGMSQEGERGRGGESDIRVAPSPPPPLASSAARADRARRAGGAGAGARGASVRRDGGGGRGGAEAQPADGLPLRAGGRVHEVLRELPGPGGGHAGAAGVAPAPLRPDGPHSARGPRPARHPRGGKDVVCSPQSVAQSAKLQSC